MIVPDVWWREKIHVLHLERRRRRNHVARRFTLLRHYVSVVEGRICSMVYTYSWIRAVIRTRGNWISLSLSLFPSLPLVSFLRYWNEQCHEERSCLLRFQFLYHNLLSFIFISFVPFRVDGQGNAKINASHGLTRINGVGRTCSMHVLRLYKMLVGASERKNLGIDDGVLI